MTRVLAVDDSRTIRDLIRFTLEQAGMDILLAEDGQDGLDQIDDAAPDVAITDINMPRLDGFGFIDGVRGQAKYRNLPILVLTTESSAELKDRARRAGATGWIVKPFDPDKLVKSIRMVAR